AALRPRTVRRQAPGQPAARGRPDLHGPGDAPRQGPPDPHLRADARPQVRRRRRLLRDLGRRVPGLLQHRRQPGGRHPRARVRAGMPAEARGDHLRRRRPAEQPEEARGRRRRRASRRVRRSSMSAEKLIIDAEALLKPYAVGAFSRTPVGVEAVIKREDLPAAAKALVDARWGYLSAITGLDHPWPKTAEARRGAGRDADRTGRPDRRPARGALPVRGRGGDRDAARDASPITTRRIPTICRGHPVGHALRARAAGDVRHHRAGHARARGACCCPTTGQSTCTRCAKRSRVDVGAGLQTCDRGAHGHSTGTAQDIRRADRAAASGPQGAGPLRVHGGRRDRHGARRCAWATCIAGSRRASKSQNWAQSLYLLERICGICSHVHATAYALGVEAAGRRAGAAARAGDPRAGRRTGARAQPPAVAGRGGARGRIRHAVHVLVARPRDDHGRAGEADRQPRQLLVQRARRREVRHRRQTQADAIRRGVDFLEERTHHYLKVVTTDETLILAARGGSAP
ncbi:MAG: hypothetical protein MZU79_00580, partial [Anaerotruncus sp.]|nr:hypothetical protein [Anaerotruncus sp.]